jgi:aldehyde:ferredoxin oxidoreductase
MANGYAGKILRINLTNRTLGRIDTAKYEQFGGGLGIGAAIFWDLAVAPGEWNLQDAFDPRNVISIMTGPLAATGVPGAGRTSVCGVSPETFPVNWFSRTNFGGRFANALKLAGWDGVVVEGKADRPVWINIINDKVVIEDAMELWGVNTYETQAKITTMVGGRTRFGDEWQQIGNDFTTARPQIVCIGPIGEAKTRIGALIHGSGVSARTGGFGGVFGSKNLKAISVTGTGGIKAADPKGVVDTRLWHITEFPKPYKATPGAASCMPCLNCDRRRNSYHGGETMCVDQYWYNGKGDALQDLGSEMSMKYGLSGWGGHFSGLAMFESDVPGAPELFKHHVPVEPGLGWYIKYLYDKGVLGPGKKIDSYPLQMEQFEELSFREAFLDAIARRIGIGDALADGLLDAAKKWGRLEEDQQSGALRSPAWGSVYHWTLPGVEWAYSDLFMTGDPSWHGFFALGQKMGGGPGSLGEPAGNYSVERMLEIMSAKTIPYTGNPLIFNYAWKGEEAKKTGIYSEHKAKQVAWTRHFAGFWNESMAFCEMMLPVFINIDRKDNWGPSPDVELRYYQAVTGNKFSFADTMEIGRKGWTLERAIRVMQGRKRDNEKFTPFMYKPGASAMNFQGGVPVYENGKWSWQDNADMYFDRDGVELFKTHFYKLEGWDDKNGWPTRKTLEELGLKHVADTMAGKGKLGA